MAESQMSGEAPDFIPDEQAPAEQPQQQSSAPDFIADGDEPKDEAPDFIPDGQEPPEDTGGESENPHSTVGQQALTIAEGLGQGYAGPAATLAEQGLSKLGVPGLSDEDIQARREANPWEFGLSQAAGMGAGLVTGTGEAKLLSQVTQKVGSKTLKNMIQMGLFSAGDEVSKMLLGQGDPGLSTAAHIIGSSIIGGAGTKLFEPIEKSGLKAIENMKLGKAMTSFISGIGHSAMSTEEGVVPLAKSAFNEEEQKGMSKAAFWAGQTVHQNALKLGVAGAVGLATGHIESGVLAGGVEHYLEKLLKPISSKVNSKIAPAFLNAASEGYTKNLSDVLDHATIYQNGYSKLVKGIDDIFNKPLQRSIIDYNVDDMERSRNKTKKHIDENELSNEINKQQQSQQPQGFAQGGPVLNQPNEPTAIQSLWPKENVLLSAAKGRVTNYLGSLRPQKNPGKLPYDGEHKNKLAEKEYDSAIDLANHPLSILNKIKSGSLTPKYLSHLTTMFPEVHAAMSNEITKKITEGQLKNEEKPPHKVRQALSLFLGTNLDSTTLPQNIVAAQNVFILQQAQKQVPQKASGSLTNLGKNLQTPEQARSSRLNKS